MPLPDFRTPTIKELRRLYRKYPLDEVRALILEIGIAITGTWSGEVGENYLAWAALLKRDKAKEKEVLAAYAAKKQGAAA